MGAMTGTVRPMAPTARFNLAALLRRRLELGWSQSQLAARADLTPAAVRRIEAGINDPRAATVKKLADALDVNPDELWIVE